MIRTKRVYDPISAEDGRRILVDRLWPRGLKKEALALDAWLKELAPSDELRRWFNHDPTKWEAFQARYAIELETKRDLWLPLISAEIDQPITFLYAARDTQHNNAVALKAILDARRDDAQTD